MHLCSQNAERSLPTSTNEQMCTDGAERSNIVQYYFFKDFLHGSFGISEVLRWCRMLKIRVNPTWTVTNQSYGLTWTTLRSLDFCKSKHRSGLMFMSKNWSSVADFSATSHWNTLDFRLAASRHGRCVCVQLTKRPVGPHEAACISLPLASITGLFLY